MSEHVKETDRFVFFWKGWPSQWYASRFVVGGVAYGCAEQYMMAEKARLFGDVEAAAAIVGTSSPRQQKAMGRAVRGFEKLAWERVCREVVFTGNLAKFGQNKPLAKLLLATGGKTLVEASPVDCIWGIGWAANDVRASEPLQWRGTNWLGLAMERVRGELNK